jgi:LmbE family N-acetylglucosaminyl deacetylase
LALSNACNSAALASIRPGDLMQNRVELSPHRPQEKNDALEILGVRPDHMVCLGLPDRDVPHHESRLRNLTSIFGKLTRREIWNPRADVR